MRAAHWRGLDVVRVARQARALDARPAFVQIDCVLAPAGRQGGSGATGLARSGQTSRGVPASQPAGTRPLRMVKFDGHERRVLLSWTASCLLEKRRRDKSWRARARPTARLESLVCGALELVVVALICLHHCG